MIHKNLKDLLLKKKQLNNLIRVSKSPIRADL